MEAVRKWLTTNFNFVTSRGQWVPLLSGECTCYAASALQNYRSEGEEDEPL